MTATDAALLEKIFTKFNEKICEVEDAQEKIFDRLKESMRNDIINDMKEKPEQKEFEYKYRAKKDALALAVESYSRVGMVTADILIRAHDFEMYLRGHTYNDPHNDKKDYETSAMG